MAVIVHALAIICFIGSTGAFALLFRDWRQAKLEGQEMDWTYAFPIWVAGAGVLASMFMLSRAADIVAYLS